MRWVLPAGTGDIRTIKGAYRYSGRNYGLADVYDTRVVREIIA